MASLLELPEAQAQLPVLQPQLGALRQVTELLGALLHEPVPGGVAALPPGGHLHHRLAATSRHEATRRLGLGPSMASARSFHNLRPRRRKRIGSTRGFLLCGLQGR